MTQPINLEGVQFFDIDSISVNEWHRLPDGAGEPEQVHLWVEVKDFGYPFVVRFKSPEAVDELIVALMTHRKGVWG